ncbi:D-alanyl-D-alanine carboxypeptidase [Leptothermofonsia sichuanensis E412]|uniref:D-alanyl-D-alanine carboxypeptidase n=1 Tax=Leptothermofonsia sichuanensis TaxID=2917832 RepID=UPI001CA75793|nr:D-alanyl-D-alanine carboxypeptidase [Leptothermofonsia sichuanensis]QZZ21834.1 D-alanyl-D-alanine carboxypeptidase [Leptothermofonsia sichuanensis E412]
MLELFSSGLFSLWLRMAGVPDPVRSVNLVAVTDTPWMVAPGEPDTTVQLTLQQYLQQLSKAGLPASSQGVWLQTGSAFLASNQGTTPLPAASLTKVATSLVALHHWGPNHQFETQVSATGPVENGVLQGDLVVHGGGDPLMVWEEAIAIGNDLNRLGIRRVTGSLIVTGNFLMNFETNPQKAGALLKQALNSTTWSEEARYQYSTMPRGTARPQVAIAGPVQVVTYGIDLLPPQTQLLRHYSLPLSQILKLMNVYSNNVIADVLANSLGGAQQVAHQSALLAGFPRHEILLKNGSGLGVENRISPRAVCAMFAALQRYLQPRNQTIADLFPISGVDHGGTIDYRKIPNAAVVKTGTLNDVSALAGVLPTRDRGLVWFTIINRGTNLDGLRDQQDGLLQSLINRWGAVPSVPLAIAPSTSARAAAASLGASNRTHSVRSAVEVNTYQGN